jgi:hypothetical protein
MLNLKIWINSILPDDDIDDNDDYDDNDDKVTITTSNGVVSAPVSLIRRFRKKDLRKSMKK